MPASAIEKRRFRLLRRLLGLRLVRMLLIAIILAAGVLLAEFTYVRPGSMLFGALLFLPLYAAAIALALGARARYGRPRHLSISQFNELLALTPTEFERAIAQLLRDRGYREVRHSGGPGDLAADITCRDSRGHSVIVQCKRYAPGARVGSRDIQSFIGMLAVHHGADRGIFVTTSEFTPPAAKLAREHDVELIDATRLKQLVADQSRPGRSAAGLGQ